LEPKIRYFVRRGNVFGKVCVTSIKGEFLEGKLKLIFEVGARIDGFMSWNNSLEKEDRFLI